MRFLFLLTLVLWFPSLSTAASRCPKHFRWNSQRLRCERIGTTGGRPIKAKPKKPSVTIPMILIKPGTFMMGSDKPTSKKALKALLHRVKITTPFFLAKYEVTRKLWTGVMGTTPFEKIKCSDQCPAGEITWRMAIEFCNKLSKLKKLKPCYTMKGDAVLWDRKCKGYRLPTEAEWEYAARAGDTTHRPSPLGSYAWYLGNAAGLQARPSPKDVGTRLPNRWGLYDMIGSVFEWVWDVYAPYQETPAKSFLLNPVVSGPGLERIFRGACYLSHPSRIGYHRRVSALPTHQFRSIGFRLARTK
ncbi:formylglycine-generating enzyme family protein [Myxococcota bacterium]|nr:formylglycine-generating enzyme family protein [Myxococcota bacterium]